MISELFVWIWLPGTTDPVVCGRLWRVGNNIRFVYGKSYRERPDAIPLMPKMMPLSDTIYSARRTGQLPGPIADTAPDAWGRRVIEYGHKAGALGELEYLGEGHGDRIGALHFQRSSTQYAPPSSVPATVSDLLQAAEALEQNRPLPPALASALEHGTSIGGARPKATVQDGSRSLIAKFSSTTDRWSNVRTEWACMRLARRCGIQTAHTEFTNTPGKDTLLVERFDRVLDPTSDRILRRQMLSALTLLDLDDTEARLASYPNLAEMLRQIGADGRGDAEELFRRMVFNILIGNTDDHAKNHATFWDGHCLRLTPAYDLVLTPRVGEEANQTMEVGAFGRESSIANALSEAGRFGLKPKDASAIIDHVEATLIEHWRSELRACGIPEHEIDRLDGRTVLSPAVRRRA